MKRRKKRSTRVFHKRIQFGQTSIFIILIALAIGLLLLLPGETDYSTGTSGNPFCRPEVDDNGNPKPDAPRIDVPAYIHETGEEFPKLVNPSSARPYVLVKSKVPLSGGFYDPTYSKPDINPDPDIYCTKGELDLTVAERYHRHFCQWVHDPIVSTPNTSGAKRYAVLFPYSWSEDPGFSSGYPSEIGDNRIFFSDYQLIFLLYLKPEPDNEPITIRGKDKNGNPADFILVDVYQRVEFDSSGKAIPQPNPLPKHVIKCKDPEAGGRIGEYTFDDSILQNKSGDKKQLQLEYFLFKTFYVEASWYYPACKPAIYLYPEKEIHVNVQVKPHGFFTYTNPLYSDSGWKVLAKPDGTVIVDGENYPYLYYESKIHDEYVKKPEKGYMVRFDELSALYDRLLPQLGLLGNQITEFKDYWQKALPFAPYYFVGVMDKESIDAIEPLQITPDPATIIRARLYFEALDRFKIVEPPTITSPTRSGFTVVEWGGMVKTNPGDTFTCSQ